MEKPSHPEPIFIQEIEENKLEKRINNIESIDCGLAPRIMMVLVILGFKPTTDLSLFVWNEEVGSVKRKLKEANLFFDDIKKNNISSNQTADFAVARSQEIASRVAYLFSNVSENDEELGKYMGYPLTAVEAFVGKRKRMDDQKSESEFEKNGIPTAFWFRLSEDGWEEELETLKEWVDAIRKNAPELWREIDKDNQEI